MDRAIALAAAIVVLASAGCAATSPGDSPAAPSLAGGPPGQIARSDVMVLTAGDPTAADEIGPVPAVDLTPQVLFQLLAAELAAQRGEIGSAWSTLMSVARQTRDPRVARRALEVALGARALDEATQSARLWRELAPQSRPAAQALESLLVSGGRLKEAEPLIAQRLARARADGTLPAAWAQTGRALQRSPDRAGVWQMVQRLSADDLNVAAARSVRAEAAAAADDLNAAVAESREAVRLAPDDEDAVLAAARTLHRVPAHKAEALALLDRHLQRSPMSLEARYTYARLLLADGRADDARVQLERVLAQNPSSPGVLLALAQIAYQGKQPAEAKRYLERFVALPRSVPRDDAVAMLFLAQIAEEQGNLAEAIDWLARVPRGEQYVAATVRRAVLMGKSGQVEQARALLQSVDAGSPRDRALLLSAEAQVLREARRNQEAFDVLDRGLQRMPDNPDLLYDHAMAAERLDRITVMEASLRRLIELRPDNAHAYNALGYTFADRNVRLAEARTLIEKAVALAPDDAHILDSMGWVLYRQKDLPRALEYLQKAYALKPEVEIAAHLGEVLWASGRTDEARRLWREARGREPDNTTLRETLARLNVAL